MRHTLPPLAALLLGTCLTPALTATATRAEDIDLGEIVLYGNLSPAPAGSVGASVTEIDAAALARDGTLPLTDKLRQVPGVSVGTQGPVGAQVGVTIRGVNQNNIAVRFDGIDISDPSGPQVAYDFGGLSTATLGRVDVLRGSESALYGSEAIGGAILMQSKRASAPGTEVEGGMEAGAYGTRAADVSVATRGERAEVSLGLSRYHTDGFSAADENDGNTEADGYDQTRATLFAGFDLTEADRIEVSGFASRSRLEFDDVFGGSGTDANNVSTKRDHGARLAYSHDFGGATLTASLSDFRIDRKVTYDGAFGISTYTYAGARREADVHLAFAPAAGVDAVVGVTRAAETYTDDARTRDTIIDSIYAEATWAVAPATDLTFNLRRDQRSDFGGRWTGRVAVAHRMGEDMTLRASFGTGYRAPSNYELYDVWSGNAALGVETSRSADIGIEKRYARGSVTLTAFALEARNLIDYSFAGFTYIQRPGTATRRGIELSTEWDLGQGTTLDGAYTWTRTGGTASLDSSGWAATAPEHQLTLGLAHEVGRTTLRANALAVAGRQGLEDYAVVNIGAERRINDHVKAYVRVENLFDRQYQTVPGYGTSDRAAFFGVRVTN